MLPTGSLNRRGVWCRPLLLGYSVEGSSIRRGQTSLLYAATSLLNCYKKACTGHILHRLIWMEFISMLSMYAQFGVYM